MKNFKKIALVFVLIISFGVIFAGCNLFGGDDPKKTLTIQEIDEKLSQNYFANFSGVDIYANVNDQKYPEQNVYETIKFDGENALTHYDNQQYYYKDGMCYKFDIDLRTKQKYAQDYPYYLTQLPEIYFSKVGFNSATFKVNISEELISSNSLTQTTTGYKLKVVLNTTKAKELGVIPNSGEVNITKYDVTFEFNNLNNVVGVYIEAIGQYQDGKTITMVLSIKNFVGTVVDPAGFNADEYTLINN